MTGKPQWLTYSFVRGSKATLLLFFKFVLKRALVGGAKQSNLRSAVNTVVGLGAFEVENVLATTRTVLGVFEKIIA